MCKDLDYRAMFLASMAALSTAAFIAGMAVFLTPRTTQALPIYARQTRLPCSQCHVNPAGGGPRTAFGQAFAANGHRLPGKTRRSGRR